jgi:hypothetical protein
VPPLDVRLTPGLQDPYQWSFLPEKRRLFGKYLSKDCIQAYKKIHVGVGEPFETLPADGSLNDIGFPGVKASPERICDYETATRPAISFTAGIDEPTSRNAELEVQLE